ncbi:sigma-54-dependent transcriptional regulator [Salidesulfovibrio onnuriiensis]|uniref:sigma-54-dependent transcriptional regulator n=1 Tax=Salidesulfovibrio onnuriiensis TaxID=2583823 RepID=UPI0011CB853A|nr:sigma-54 dependent transcriptional regulator [Salidesulfovibrio onnuriiensis]
MNTADAPVILAVDDDENILTVLEARLESAGYETLLADCAETALEMLADTRVDLIVSDVKMPGMGGQGLLEEVLRSWPHIPVIMLTAHGTIPDAVNSIQAGAADYVTKPFDGRDLLDRIARNLEAAPAPKTAKLPPASNDLWGGEAAAMRHFLSLLERVAPAEANVLLLGESGTGKERVAQIIHERSPRASGPFIVVDCGSTQPTLLESELFGHVKGSFTHAVRDKKGLIEEADGGTLFLDEIGNISPEMQTRLLRFLQERTIRRVGDTKERKVSCRVISATNASLPDMVREGSFREDLYYRLKVVALTIPPLRKRVEDIPILARRFAEMYCKAQSRPVADFTPEAMRLMQEHPWPGNVRELQHAVEGALVFCQGNSIRPEDLQLEILDAPLPDDDSLSLEDNERKAIIRALEHCNGVKKAAADELGISRRAIHYKIKKYNIDAPG